MRLTSIGIIILALGAYPAASTIASRARAASGGSSQDSPRGPMPNPSSPGNTSQNQQQAPPPEPPQTSETLKSPTTVVNVFATVRDKKNGIVPDLTKDDFKVYEDGVEQKVAFFTKEVDMPISLAMLMDTSGSMYYIMGAEQQAASSFVEEVMHKKDEALVMTFDTDVNLLADFTEDTNVLKRAIRRAQVNAAGPMITPGTVPTSGGGTNLYDAVYLACHDELSNEAGRKAIVLITDAEDNGSKMSEYDAAEAAQRADTVLHFISEELRSQYVLGYYPINTDHDGTFRKIKVEVSRPDVKILARKGYYAPGR
jgi:Mg-chelatase subunit ChlD